MQCSAVQTHLRAAEISRRPWCDPFQLQNADGHGMSPVPAPQRASACRASQVTSSASHHPAAARCRLRGRTCASPGCRIIPFLQRSSSTRSSIQSPPSRDVTARTLVCCDDVCRPQTRPAGDRPSGPSPPPPVNNGRHCLPRQSVLYHHLPLTTSTSTSVSHPLSPFPRPHPPTRRTRGTRPPTDSLADAQD